MIRPEEFPYIKSLHVNDCYAYQDFDIHLNDYQPFSHLILTGKNGSGKSTILRFLNNYFDGWRSGNVQGSGHSTVSTYISSMKNIIPTRIASHGNQDNVVLDWQKSLKSFECVIPISRISPDSFWKNQEGKLLYSYFRAKRVSNVSYVSAPSKQVEFTQKLNSPDSTDFFVSKFKQYLVNQKVEQAFNQIDHQQIEIEYINQFFDKIEYTFRNLFMDNSLRIEFDRNNYEFYLVLSDGRKLTFDTLSEGFSALLSILMDLFTRVDLIRKQVGSFTYNPCGVVLIDEPETHLHLQLQEQILPLLTNLFPNVQFIVATHSPAVIASIKHATVFDLTTKETTGDEIIGRSYSDLAVTHFGLENDYSNEADKIIREVNDARDQYESDPAQLHVALQKIYQEQGEYLSPTLRVELELMMAQVEARHAAHP